LVVYFSHILQIFVKYIDSTQRGEHIPNHGRQFYCEGCALTGEQRKRAKFRELAEKRTNKALESIRLIGNLSNRQTYVFDEAEVRKIVKALRDAISDVEGRFGKASSRNGGEFKL
jgi:hypothetical protein